jgi:hypothetical protein
LKGYFEITPSRFFSLMPILTAHRIGAHDPQFGGLRQSLYFLLAASGQSA